MSRTTLRKFAHLASLLVIFGLTATVGSAQAERIYICHLNQGSGYIIIEVPPQATSGHFDADGNPIHQGDHLTTVNDVASCGVTTSPTPTPSPGGDDPDPTPEPVTMLLFGAGVAGVGYAVRKLRRKGDGTQE